MVSSINALTVSCLQAADAFDKLKNVWETLERKDIQCMPANTWRWAQLWWHQYAKPNDTLAIMIVRSGRQIVAIAPLYIDTGTMCRVVPIRVLRFIGSGRDTSPDYLNIIALPAFRQAAEKVFLKHLYQVKGWHKLQLSDINEKSSLLESVREYTRQQSGALLPEQHNTLRCASLPYNWDKYLARCSEEFRQQINERQKQLATAGVSELSICATAEELAQASDALVALHRLHWQSSAKSVAAPTKKYERFHRAIIDEFFARDALWLVTLKLNNEIVGVQYCFVWRGQLQFFQCGYSPELAHLSPEHLLFDYTVKRGIRQGLEGIEILKGCDAQIANGAKDHVTTCEVGFIRSGFRSMLGRMVR